jgi:hypothetical protein
MSYRVISVNAVWSQKRALERLVKEVNEAISIGWEPVGGICHIGATIAQALVKRR